MLRTVNYCQMLSDDNPIKTMSIHVFKCFLLFVSNVFFFVPGTCRIRCLLSYASSEKDALSSQFIVQDVQKRIVHVNGLTTSARLFTDTHFHSNARTQTNYLSQ